MARDLANELYHKIINDYIFNYENPDGMLLEQDIALKYSVSKTPAREALIHLVNDKILTKYPCKGYVFRTIPHEEMRQIAETRIFLEAGAFELIIQNATDEELQELQKINVLSPDADHIDLLNYNYNFHKTVVSLCKNPFLIEQVDRILILITRTCIAQFSNPQVIRVMIGLFIESHQRILDALMKRSLSEARQALRDDIFD